MKTLTIRMSDELLEELKDLHAQTFADHRQSFNAWVVKMIHGAWHAEYQLSRDKK